MLIIIVTKATGNLGHHIINKLLEQMPAEHIVAVIKNPQKTTNLTKHGVKVHQTDYNKPATLGPAFKKTKKIMFISTSKVGKRIAQHRNIIKATQKTTPALLI